MAQEALAKKKGIADIALVIDVTMSMAKCIGALKTNIGVLVEAMTNPGPNAEAAVKDWRIKVVGYRDYKADGDQWWFENPFTSNLEELRSSIAALEAKGGGDEPESLLDALWKLVRLPTADEGAPLDPGRWRHRHDASRVVIVFTDATCHTVTSLPEANGATLDDVGREIMAARWYLSLICPEADCYQAISEWDKVEVENFGTLTDAQTKLAAYSADQANFTKTLKALAKTISASVPTPIL